MIFFFFGANSDDLLGRELSRKILHYGLMGLGNLALAITALVMYFDFRKQTAGGASGEQSPQ